MSEPNLSPASPATANGDLSSDSPQGGGFTEVFAVHGAEPEVQAYAMAKYSRSSLSMKESLRGRVLYAECGGFMYLADAIRTRDGAEHAMLGLVRGTAVMHGSLQAIGYVEVETVAPTLFGPAGTRMRGHQFRWSTLEGAAPNAYRGLPAWAAGDVLGSYVHVHWASNPAAAESFVRRCMGER